MTTLTSQTAAPPAASKPSSMRPHASYPGQFRHGFLSRLSRGLPLFVLFLGAISLRAQETSDPNAIRWVRAAVDSQLYSDAHDIPWMYKDHNIQPGHDSLTQVVDTPHGGIRRTLVANGVTYTGANWDSETARIHAFVTDPAAQARERKNSAHDDQQATALLKMWTEAFILKTVSETGDLVTISYKPNPAFNPPSMEAKVMSQMQGEMVITRNGSHIRSIRGRLMQDIHLAFGIVKLKAGGTIDVERREVTPGHWQVIEEHTHIEGHALLFKSISSEEDDTKTDIKPSPAQTLADAERILAVH